MADPGRELSVVVRYEGDPAGEGTGVADARGLADATELTDATGLADATGPPDGTGKAGGPRPSRAFPVVLGLCLALAAGYQIGQVGHTHAGLGTAPHTHGPMAGMSGVDVGGLAISAAGFTLVPEPDRFTAGVPGTLRFRILGADRAPVARYGIVSEKPLHLIVARRDLTGYQHLHPVLGSDGVWTTPLTLSEPGLWRIFADFAPIASDGTQTALTLGADVPVAGEYDPEPLPAVATGSAVDGLTVSYTGTASAGATQPLLFSIRGTGGAAPTLQHYLGSYGHLVVLREGDLGYLHVHPDPDLVSGAIRFWLTAPSSGRYRMFLDFQVDGVVHTAAFTLAVP